jgi:lipopolysaccharide transport system permease protein
MSEASAEGVPRVPTVIIEPRSGWRDLGLRELFEHRELLYFFTWRDLKVRYKQTAFGIAWAVLQPFLLMIIFSVSVGRLKGVTGGEIPYPLFVFSALVPWTLFAVALGGAASSLVTSESVVTKVYFPRLLLPFGAVASFVIDYLFALVVLAGLMAWYGVAPGWAALSLPLWTVQTIAVALGVGTFLAAVNVRYRDVRYVVPFLIQVWLFSSPVIYASTLIPQRWHLLYSLNPMVGVIEGFRWALVRGPRPGSAVLVSVVVTIAILGAALAYFRRVERTFADVI